MGINRTPCLAYKAIKWDGLMDETAKTEFPKKQTLFLEEVSSAFELWIYCQPAQCLLKRQILSILSISQNIFIAMLWLGLTLGIKSHVKVVWDLRIWSSKNISYLNRECKTFCIYQLKHQIATRGSWNGFTECITRKSKGVDNGEIKILLPLWIYQFW